MALETESSVHDWESRVRTCAGTRAHVSAGRARDGDLERMRAAVNHLRTRAEAVDKQTKYDLLIVFRALTVLKQLYLM